MPRSLNTIDKALGFTSPEQIELLDRKKHSRTRPESKRRARAAARKARRRNRR